MDYEKIAIVVLGLAAAVLMYFGVIDSAFFASVMSVLGIYTAAGINSKQKAIGRSMGAFK